MAVLSLPGVASAATYYVRAGEAGTQCTQGAPCDTIQEALTAAVGDGHTIDIGPGTFAAPTETILTDTTFLGAGATTVIEGEDGVADNEAGGAAISADKANLTLEDLHLVGGTGSTNANAGAGGPALRALTDVPQPDAETVILTDVRLTAGATGDATEESDGAAILLDVTANQINLDATRVLAEAASGPGEATLIENDGVGVRDYTFTQSRLNGSTYFVCACDATFTDSILTGDGQALFTLKKDGTGLLTLDRTRVVQNPFGGVSVEGIATIRDSLIVPGAAAAFESAEALDVFSGTFAEVDLIGSTLIGGTPAGSNELFTAVRVAGASTLRMKNSVAVNPDPGTDGVDLTVTGGASINPDSSAFRSAVASGGSTAPTPGANGNLNAPPQLAPSFAPLSTSPLIDRGDPAFIGQSPKDILGAPRSRDGNCDSIARPDIGAFEVACPPAGAGPGPGPGPGPGIVRPPANAKPVISRIRARRGRRGRITFTFNLSERATVTFTFRRRKGKRYVRAGSVRFRGKAGKNRFRFSGKIKRKRLKRGRYRIRVSAKDPQGRSSTAKTIRFRQR